MCRYANGEAR